MRLAQFEHLVAAAAEVTGQDEFVVVGSQAILGSVEEPDSMLQSMEAHIYPVRSRKAADLIDGNLGDGSQFHAAFGYNAHAVGPETAKPPRGWEKRLVRRAIRARPRSDRTAVVWCLELHDLVLSKLVAGRERDWEYAAEALKAGLVHPEVLLGRVPDLAVSDGLRTHIDNVLRGMVRCS